MGYDWLPSDPVTVPADLRAFVGGRPLTAETLVRRGIVTVEAARRFLDPAAYPPAPAEALPGVEVAAARIEAAIRARERICVWGDFDVDGQTSTTLLVATLRDLGADVLYHIPVRETESHGVNVENLQVAFDAGAQLILTCDTGIDAFAAVDYANARGVEVIITDHHELPAAGGLPAAHVVVNPHLLSSDHPLATLPGVGVAYKLAEALYARAGRPAEVEQHLDLVALGIVADVAELVGDTRYLLQRGLPALRQTTRLGLREMFALAQVTPAQVNEETIGFMIAPRLNALGRLADARSSVEFFTTTDLAQARILAGQLETLNTERKRLCDEVEQGALAQIERDPALLEHGALVLESAHWPAGVIGIVANRLVERYNRPAILLTAPPGEPARGSARSVEGCHITEALATQSPLLLRYGGHAMAAGLALDPVHIPELRRGLSRAVLAQRGVASAQSPLVIDAFLPLADLSLELVDDLERLAPFGSGNPALTLATRGVRVQSYVQLGRNQDHLAVIVEDEHGSAQRVLWWHAAPADIPAGTLDLAYTVRANTFRGERRLQVEWVNARVVEPPAPSLLLEIPRLEIVDYRREPHPATLLKPLLGRADVQIWAEAVGAVGAAGATEAASDVAGLSRWELAPGATLVLWTAPPGPEVLGAVIAHVKPRQVIVFWHDPGLDELNAFFTRLGGLVKYAIKERGGRVEPALLAALLAHREETIRKGLAWLTARGYIAVAQETAEALLVLPGDGSIAATSPRLTAELKALLDETAAYRRYFRQAEADALF